jgi:cell division protein FtsL
LASWSHAQAVAEPIARPRRRTRRRARARARGGILWIVVSGILLAGVVFVNVAVLQLNLSLDRANGDRSKLRADIAALQSQLSTELASQRIQSRAAQQYGLVYTTNYGYVNLAK